MSSIPIMQSLSQSQLEKQLLLYLLRSSLAGRQLLGPAVGSFCCHVTDIAALCRIYHLCLPSLNMTFICRFLRELSRMDPVKDGSWHQTGYCWKSLIRKVRSGPSLSDRKLHAGGVSWRRKVQEGGCGGWSELSIINTRWRRASWATGTVYSLIFNVPNVKHKQTVQKGEIFKIVCTFSDSTLCGIK